MQRVTNPQENKKKIVVMLDKNVVKIINDRAGQEGRTISDIVQEAVVKYNDVADTDRDIRRNAVKNFTSRPFNLKTSELQEFLNQDYYQV